MFNLRMRKDGHRRATIRVTFHVDADLAAKIVASSYFDKNEGDPGCDAVEKAIRSGLYNNGGADHYHLVHEGYEEEEWKANLERASSVIRRYWPRWNFEPDAEVKARYAKDIS